MVRASAAAALPAWCATDGLEEALKKGRGDVKDALQKDDVNRALKALVRLSCMKDDGSTVYGEVDEHRAELDAARQSWSQKLDLIEADWADVAMWFVGGSYNDMRPDDKLAWSSYDAIEQYMKIAWPEVDKPYVADALGTHLTESGRLAFIQDCLAQLGEHPTRWAQCQPDIDVFQPQKISAEMRAGVAGCPGCGYQRTLVRMAAFRVRANLAGHAADVKKLIAEDATYGKLFEISAAVRKEWDGLWRTHAALLAMVATMDDARVTNSRKAVDGCDEKTAAAWTSAIGKIPAKEFENMHDEAGSLFLDKAVQPILNDPEAYLASLAFATCRAVASYDRAVARLATALQYVPGYRGPRTAAMSAMMNAGLTLDDRDAKLRFPSVKRDWFDVHADGNNGYGKGVIASVKADGKKVHVTFAAKIEQQTQCAEARATNRVTRIDSDGRLVYEQRCIKTKVVTVNTASDPQDVDVLYAAGLKPGAFTSIAGGVAQAVWPKGTATVPSFVFGAPVK